MGLTDLDYLIRHYNQLSTQALKQNCTALSIVSASAGQYWW